MGNREFGEYLRSMREAKGLSQFQLGKMVGVSDKAVSKWENGYANPTNIFIPRLSKLFGVSTDELFDKMYSSGKKEKTEIGK